MDDVMQIGRIELIYERMNSNGFQNQNWYFGGVRIFFLKCPCICTLEKSIQIVSLHLR